MLATAGDSRFRADVSVLCALASVVVLLHCVVGNGYGFHRDELQTLDDARHLAAGFVAYPPLTPIAGRIAIAIGGISPWVFRWPAVLANAVSLLLVGLTARELGGRRTAQVVALLMSLSVAIVFSTMLQYNTFDYLAWALATFFTARVLRTGDGRWWLGVGAALGLGVLSKYSIAFLALSVAAGLAALPSQRHWLRSRWLWLGILVMVAVASPNLIWLTKHDFVTLRMEHAIHARDVRLGRAAGFWADQVKFNLLGSVLVIAGLVWLARSARYKLLAFFFLGPLVLIAAAHGRGYYVLPAYIAVNAAAGVTVEQWVSSRGAAVRRLTVAAVCLALVADVVPLGARFVQIARPGSALFAWQWRNSDDIADEVGWPEFVEAVAKAHDLLSANERESLAILAENYGEAGALEVYGPALGLPPVRSQVNSWFARGYGSLAPENVLITGGTLRDLTPLFESCRVAGVVRIPYGVENEESRYHREIYLCHHLLGSWEKAWNDGRKFG